MKIKHTLILALSLSLSPCISVMAQHTKADLPMLIRYMEGSYSSEAQAKADTNYLHITLDMKRIWPDHPNGAWLYVEQTAAWTPGKPYRQRVYHLQQQSDSTFTSTIYSMPHPQDFVGAQGEPQRFANLTPDSLTLLPGCALQLTYRNQAFAGATEVGQCLNAWGKAAYATSEVQVYPDYLYSWDRGWNAQHEQVWGAEKGGYKFIRK